MSIKRTNKQVQKKWLRENKNLKILDLGCTHINFWSEANQDKLKLQRETINATYSWDARSLEWKNFFEEARKSKV